MSSILMMVEKALEEKYDCTIEGGRVIPNDRGTVTTAGRPLSPGHDDGVDAADLEGRRSASTGRGDVNDARTWMARIEEDPQQAVNDMMRAYADGSLDPSKFKDWDKFLQHAQMRVQQDSMMTQMLSNLMRAVHDTHKSVLANVRA